MRGLVAAHEHANLPPTLKRHLSIFVLATFVGLLAGCAAPPLPTDRVESQALTDTAQTRLGQAVAPRLAQHPGLSGFMPFEDPHDAFAARVLLSRLADRSLDVQYFIWHGDAVGTLLWQAMWEAAERGVRVRLLVDDANNAGLDPVLAALDAHPNLELRLYNPFVNRGSRVIGYLTDFGRLNRRMHNKSFTADNQVSVVGGRNIADEYFGAAEGLGFADLDVMAIGAMVQEVSREFDLYWNSASAYPAAPFVGPPPADPAAVLQPRFEAVPQDPRAALYLQAVRQAPFVQELLERRLEFDWATGQVLYDNPAKTLDASADSDLILLPVLMRRMGSPQQRLDIISPYFVPGAVGTEMLADMARRGVQVRVHDQFAGLVGRARRARRLPEAAHGPAARRRAVVRAEARRRQVFIARARPLRAGQGLGAACQGLRRGRQAHLRRLVQLRPALRAPEHRDGLGDR